MDPEQFAEFMDELRDIKEEIQESREALQDIRTATRATRINYHKTYELNTTSAGTVRFKNDSGLLGREVEILNQGGGLSLSTGNDRQIKVMPGDVFKGEEFEVLQWTGSGQAGTALIRIGAHAEN